MQSLTAHACLRSPSPNLLALEDERQAALMVLPELGAADGPLEFAWTDGGAWYAGHIGLATASWAVYWGPGDTRNSSGLVEGEQTAQRGELRAALQAALQRRGPLIIVTDSQFVAIG